MKVKLFILILLSTSQLAFSQDYMDDIASQACECLKNVSDTLDPERLTMEAGICMIDAASPYQKRLKKDYGIDFTKIDTQGEELGRIIGIKMLSICPGALMKMAKNHNEQQKDDITEDIMEGQIIGIKDDQFVIFSIKNEQGKISKYYWFSFIESNVELSTAYTTLKDMFVQVTYISQEFFDPKIGEYRVFKIIRELEVMDK